MAIGGLFKVSAKYVIASYIDVGDTVNLDFVRNVVGEARVAGGAVVCRTPNGFPLPNGFRALSVIELR
jgi:uncharacterized protein